MSNVSHTVGSTESELLHQTIDEALGETVQKFGGNEALISCHQNIRWTYRELQHQVDKVASGLLALGLEKGDRLGIWSPNNAEWVLTQLATAKVGIILVTINPAYRVCELEYALNKVDCRALVMASRFKTSDYVAMVEELAPEISSCEPGSLKSEKLPTLDYAIVIGNDAPAGFLAFNDIAQAGTAASDQKMVKIAASLDPDDAINIQFTSGTTGFPKGATLSHKNILNNGKNVTARQNFTDLDRLCIPVPLYHCFGMVMGVLGCLTHGATMIFADEAFEPQSVLQAVSDEKCTALYGVPTMFIAELALPDFKDYDLSNLRTGVMAGSPCPVETMKQVLEQMNMSEVTICYGMTETSPVSTQTTPEDSVEKRVSTVGRVHPHVEVKIIDVSGDTLSFGQQGELCTRGYSVMKGYWGDEEKTQEAIDNDGWMHTGDIACMDEEGYVNITGRVKDMIIRGGENIYPREIEEYLYRHPAIMDVQVFGVPDEKYGEEISAWIILHEGEELSDQDVKDFCTGQIAHYKVPRYIRFVEHFPMTVTGKIQKFVMKKEMTQDLDLQDVETA
ncbi:AMP-binding protein [Terasakiella sp. SH-1]|uniref:AMP-binding protein n=1 Tax=Terasakiella sp. SH-1 TaxID=2560057 RepID=UPI00107474F9|nr:AMP-binding protein [Terasakiella sp. SH-1]